jgi:transcriptional regulator with XRE-family HTH domain
LSKQRKPASRARRSVRTLNLIHWEQGRYRPSPALLVILAQALDLDPLELLDVTARRMPADLARGLVWSRGGIGCRRRTLTRVMTTSRWSSRARPTPASPIAFMTVSGTPIRGG